MNKDKEGAGSVVAIVVISKDDQEQYCLSLYRNPSEYTLSTDPQRILQYLEGLLTGKTRIR